MNCTVSLHTVCLELESYQTLFLELHSVLMADCWLQQRDNRIRSLSTLVCRGTHSRYTSYVLYRFYMLLVLVHVQSHASIRVHLNHYQYFSGRTYSFVYIMCAVHFIMILRGQNSLYSLTKLFVCLFLDSVMHISIMDTDQFLLNLYECEEA